MVSSGLPHRVVITVPCPSAYNLLSRAPITKRCLAWICCAEQRGRCIFGTQAHLLQGFLGTKEALKLVNGQAYVPMWRQGPWAVKKALQSLFDCIRGYHVDQASVTCRITPGSERANSKPQWQAEYSNDEFRLGAKFIQGALIVTMRMSSIFGFWRGSSTILEALLLGGLKPRSSRWPPTNPMHKLAQSVKQSSLCRATA